MRPVNRLEIPGGMLPRRRVEHRAPRYRDERRRAVVEVEVVEDERAILARYLTIAREIVVLRDEPVVGLTAFLRVEHDAVIGVVDARRKIRLVAARTAEAGLHGLHIVDKAAEKNLDAVAVPEREELGRTELLALVGRHLAPKRRGVGLDEELEVVTVLAVQVTLLRLLVEVALDDAADVVRTILPIRHVEDGLFGRRGDLLAPGPDLAGRRLVAVLQECARRLAEILRPLHLVGRLKRRDDLADIALRVGHLQEEVRLHDGRGLDAVLGLLGKFQNLRGVLHREGGLVRGEHEELRRVRTLRLRRLLHQSEDESPRPGLLHDAGALVPAPPVREVSPRRAIGPLAALLVRIDPLLLCGEELRQLGLDLRETAGLEERLDLLDDRIGLASLVRLRRKERAVDLGDDLRLVGLCRRLCLFVRAGERDRGVKVLHRASDVSRRLQPTLRDARVQLDLLLDGEVGILQRRLVFRARRVDRVVPVVGEPALEVLPDQFLARLLERVELLVARLLGGPRRFLRRLLLRRRGRGRPGYDTRRKTKDEYLKMFHTECPFNLRFVFHFSLLLLLLRVRARLGS